MTILQAEETPNPAEIGAMPGKLDLAVVGSSGWIVSRRPRRIAKCEIDILERLVPSAVAEIPDDLACVAVLGDPSDSPHGSIWVLRSLGEASGGPKGASAPSSARRRAFGRTRALEPITTVTVAASGEGQGHRPIGGWRRPGAAECGGEAMAAMIHLNPQPVTLSRLQGRRMLWLSAMVS